MSEKTKQEIKDIIGDYKYGFKTETQSVLDTGKGISEEVVREISRIKGEPEWMTEFRVKSYNRFITLFPQPKDSIFSIQFLIRIIQSSM